MVANHGLFGETSGEAIQKYTRRKAVSRQHVSGRRKDVSGSEKPTLCKVKECPTLFITVAVF